ncbi:winged helix-turn-helix transcriptional regulator [Candidatus Woesearchaeota archaeon]|nr:winged helix-turn-helix transcriptional regulator [Candidatus Woesearchaeota archaeon]
MTELNLKIIKFFACLSDETRLRIVLCLWERPHTVNEIHRCLGEERITLSAISHQLKQMYDVGVVVFVKRGREKTFKLSEKFCWCILKDALGHFERKGTCQRCAKLKGEKT